MGSLLMFGVRYEVRRGRRCGPRKATLHEETAKYNEEHRFHLIHTGNLARRFASQEFSKCSQRVSPEIERLTPVAIRLGSFKRSVHEQRVPKFSDRQQ